jgi:transposase
MSTRKRATSPSPRAPTPRELPVVRPDAAGIDVGSAEHWVAVPPGRDAHPVRRFAAFTADLGRLADWLARCGITTVAMEATGVYWIPLFELLESRGLEVLLVDPRQARAVKGGPKTGRLDCQWVQRLHGCGLLAGSFRPGDAIVVLRGYLRQRRRLVRGAARHVQHMQKALEQMNVKLAEVVSDVTGVTGLSIIRAILAGRRDPAELAGLCDEHYKVGEAGLAQALHGNWREEHPFELRQALALWEYYQALVRECDREVERYLGTLPDRADGGRLPPRPRVRKPKAHEPAYDARGLVHRACGVDLTAIEGIDQATALVLLGEVGPDLGRFPRSSTSRPGWACARSTPRPGGRSGPVACARASIARPRPCAWRRGGCTPRGARWGPTTGGCGRAWGRPRRSWRRPTSWPGWSTPC